MSIKQFKSKSKQETSSQEKGQSHIRKNEVIDE